MERGLFFKSFQELLEKKSSLLFEKLSLPMKAFLMAQAFSFSKKNLLILTGEGQEESQLFQDLSFFVKKAPIELPSWEVLPHENVAPSADLVGARQKALQAIVEREAPVVVISSLQSSLQRTLPPNKLKKEVVEVRRGEKISFHLFTEKLSSLGYEKRPLVVEKGEFAVRGGLIDLFPVTETRPLRISFWEDEIESLRLFDPSSQKSSEEIERATIAQAKELKRLQEENELATVFDLLGKETIIILDDLELLEDRYASLISQGAVGSKIFMGVEEWLDEILSHEVIYLCHPPLETLSEVKRLLPSQDARYGLQSAPEPLQFSMFSRTLSASRCNHPFLSIPEFYEDTCLLSEPPEGESLIDCFLQIQKNVLHTIIYQSQVELDWFKHKIEERGGKLFPETKVHEGYLTSGFSSLETNEVYFSLAEVNGRVNVRRDTQRMTSLVTGYDAFELEEGDYVVHFHHGLGRFHGIQKKPDVKGREEEFFVIDYAEGGRLFVPLSQAHLISKYVGGKEESPKLHTLGTNRWKKLREETERAIVGYASELLKAHAARVIKGGYTFSPDSKELHLFEAEFPYAETEDQLRAIQEIKDDMCSTKAMDRLVCGDVGYGKTEVAMRAAFKAVLDGGKQVALLVPTTVLALQHYENFCERMAPFGVQVGVLSRFHTPKQNRETIERVKEKKLDIIIGTHRLIQKDVTFKDLGLVIIDEEQRFGVKAKEHLKILKEGVDCLALSATPIPRTLYLSLIGARDLSTISTPPHDRLPIKTVVSEPSDSVISTALLRELNRGGQAFYIHNRVETIFEAADRLKKLLPRARIATSHGKMNADELDLVFHSFRKGDIDILVSTSIVENGIDIPNANTIIVERADQFGISDLYQLRGRVGRWNRRAYAYFLLPKRILSDIARKRIEAIAQAGGYGGGLKVAMRDLEIRGAGDILGLEQSGHVAAIGFHLYCKLLKRTVETLQGKGPSWTIETKVEIPFHAKLPEYYVNEVSLRMEFYQRLGEARTPQEVEEIAHELHDRFGRPPEEARWLLAISRARVQAAQRGYTLLKLENVSLLLERKSGTKSESNRILVPRITTPEAFETHVVRALQSRET